MKSPYTWVKIVNNFLKQNCFDCLKNNSKECYCKVDHLFCCPFDSETFNCVPGNVKSLPKSYELES
jgi:hypothetical protein